MLPLHLSESNVFKMASNSAAQWNNPSYFPIIDVNIKVLNEVSWNIMLLMMIKCL